MIDGDSRKTFKSAVSVLQFLNDLHPSTVALLCLSSQHELINAKELKITKMVIASIQ